MKTIVGIQNLKDEFRKAKLKCGDLRGLKNRFSLSEKLGVPSLQTFYFSSGGNGKKRAELTADCYGLDEQGDVFAYNMKDLVAGLKNEVGRFEVHLICLMWNEARNDADRKTIETFIYKNNP